MISFFEVACDSAEFFVDCGHGLLKFSDGHRSPYACYNVFALSVDEELAVELILACRGVTGEADSCSAVIAQVAECHCDYVDGSTE